MDLQASVLWKKVFDFICMDIIWTVLGPKFFFETDLEILYRLFVFHIKMQLIIYLVESCVVIL